MPYAVIDYVLSGLVERYGWAPLNEKCPIIGSCTNADGTVRTVNIIGSDEEWNERDFGTGRTV